MMRFLSMLRRELLISIRSGVEAVNPIIFFLLVGTVFSLVFAGNLDVLAEVGIAAIWITALFANMLATESMFRRDYDDGTLALVLLAPTSVISISAARLSAHWLTTGLPISLLAPVLGFVFNLPWQIYPLLSLTLLIGTPVLTLIGSLGASLTVGLGRGGVLLTILVLPLYVPILFLGIGVCQLSTMHVSYTSQLVGLLAILTGTLTVVPLVLGPILKAGYDA